MIHDLERKAREQYPHLHNRAMARKLAGGTAVDLSKARRVGTFYVVENYVEGVDYCDAGSEQWIWSIGRNKATGEILASTTTMLYQNEAYECLWLR